MMASFKSYTGHIAVIIPCYNVKKHILEVLQNIPNFVWRIYVVDDASPDGCGHFVEEKYENDRVSVIYHNKNMGVGAAMMTGYKQAIADGASIMVKIDGDGQMDPSLLRFFVEPIIMDKADYTKGNRFYNLENLSSMPLLRLFGNSILSFMTKISAGYWAIFDPTNGYTAIHVDTAKQLPFDKIDNRYFFESDMLFRLNILRAVVLDIPMEARYLDEKSHLSIKRVVIPFFIRHVKNFFKRIFYNYYLRDLSIASIELPLGLLLFLFGNIYGGYHWIKSHEMGVETPTGTIILSAMTFLVGIQFILAFIGYDIASVPTRIRHRERVDND